MLRAAIQNENPNVRLSQIRTNWSQLFAATQTHSEATTEAQRVLLINYSGSVFRYLLGAVRNEHIAADLAQDFAVRFLRGDFKTVAPEKGRFRDFLKRTLSNLVNDHFRKQRAEQNRIQASVKTDSQTDAGVNPDAFDQDWVLEMLRRTWEALEDHQRENSSNYYYVLRARAESPELSSQQLCEKLSATLPNQSINEAWVRKNLSRARRVFATLLRSEVAKTLKDDQPQSVDQELSDLGLLKYCQ